MKKDTVMTAYELTGGPLGAQAAAPPALSCPRDASLQSLSSGLASDPFPAQHCGESPSKAICSRVGPTCLQLRVCEGSHILVGFRSTWRASSDPGAGPWGLRIRWDPLWEPPSCILGQPSTDGTQIFHGNEDERVWSCLTFPSFPCSLHFFLLIS